jgi:hypothetical protein
VAAASDATSSFFIERDVTVSAVKSLKGLGTTRARGGSCRVNKWRGSWYVLVVVLSAVVGRTVAAPTGMIGLGGSGVLLATICILVTTKPVLGVWLAIVSPAMELVVPSLRWQFAGVVFLVVAAMVTIKDATTPSRRAAGLWLAITLWITVDAVFFCAQSTLTYQLILGGIYCGLVGIAASLTAFSMAHVQLALIGWGATASWVAITSPGLIQDRSEVLLGENANGLGLMAALGIVGTLGCVRRYRLGLLWGLPTLVLCMSGVTASGSRGALLAAVGSALVACLFPALRGSWRRSSLVLVAAATAMIFAVRPLVEWFTTYSGRSAASYANVGSRQDALGFAITTGFDHPLTGVGIGNLAGFSLSDSTDRLGLRAHNQLAGLFAETGAIGLLLLVTLFVIAFRGAYRSDRAGGLIAVSGVLCASMSLEWWATARLGVLAVLILAAASHPTTGCGRRRLPTAQDDKHPPLAAPVGHGR